MNNEPAEQMIPEKWGEWRIECNGRRGHNARVIVDGVDISRHLTGVQVSILANGAVHLGLDVAPHHLVVVGAGTPDVELRQGDVGPELTAAEEG